MSRKRNASGIGVALLASAAMVLAACSAGVDDGGDKNLEVVRWASSTPIFGPEIAMYTSLPQELGYFEDEGIEVKFQNLAGGAAASQAVASGQADFSTTGNVPFFKAVNNGFDLVGVCANYPSFLNSPAVPEDSPIKSLKDLEGTTLGVVSLEATSIPWVKAMVKQDGGDPSTIKFVSTGLGAPAIAALESGRVDGLALWNGPYGSIEAAGVPLRKLESDEFNKLRLGSIIITNRKLAEEKPDVIVGLGRAYAKGSVFAAANPEAALRIHWKVYPESKPTGVSDKKAVEQGLVVMEQALEDAKPPEGQQWCDILPEDASVLQKVLMDADILDKAIDVDKYILNDMNDEMNDFDADEIRQQAEDYKVTK